jgi:peptide/nickel transport system substrate-binding protein
MAIRIVMVLLALTVILVIACGSAPAAPDPTATSSAPASDAAPTTAPTAPVASDTTQPTSTPQMAVPPAEVEVNPGKLSIMVGGLGSERFDFVLGSSSEGGNNYDRILHGYLVSENERRDMTSGIASDWRFSEDGLTWTFTIREGVKWHDGSELTPQDVLWFFQHAFGPQAHEYAVSTRSTRISLNIDRIELSGPDEVSLTTKTPDTTFANVVSEADAGSLYVMPKRTKLGDEQEALAYDNNPIGAGRMRLVEHVPAHVMRFERFDDFYYQPENGFPEDKRVNFQFLDLFLVPEEATRVSALRAGEADIVPASAGAKEQVEAGGGRLVFGPEGVSVEVILFGCWADPNFPCRDKRARQALSYAIDKELIRDRLYGGPEAFQVKGWNWVSPSTIGYTPELDPWPFDPDKARQLLADAGYPGGEGFGKLIVNTFPASAMPFQVEAAQLGAEFWRRELGLDVEVRVGDGVENRNKMRSGELNGQVIWRDNGARKDATTGVITGYGDPTSYQRVHEDPELFRLVQETFGILDPDKRAEASKKLFVRLREEAYDIPLGYTNIPWGVGPRVQTWEPYPLAPYPSALHTITLK